MIAMSGALDQLIDHAMKQAGTNERDFNQLGEAMDMILGIARRGGFDGEAAAVIEDFITNQLGKD